MLPRSFALRQRLHSSAIAHSRGYSVKIPHRLLPLKTGATIGRKLSDVETSSHASSSKSATTSNNPINVTVNSSNTSRNRKLTPAAKAKAQASASRALREQIGAVAGSTNDHVTIMSSGDSGKDDIKLANTVLDHPRKLYDAYAYATAESYNLEKLMTSSRLPPGWQYLEDSQVIHIPAWPYQSTTSSSNSLNSSSSGEVFIFRSGSYVTWGLNNDQSRRFLRAVIQGRQGKAQTAEIESYTEIGDEAMEYLIADDQITRVVGDVMVIGQAPRMEAEDEFDSETVEENDDNTDDPPDWSPLLARLAFSQGLSRSARLSVQEAALSDYLEQVAAIPARLEKEGSVPLHRKEIIRKMGTLLKLRQRANLDSENFLDDPEMYWENWKVEHHYDSICLALDIESRFKAYNEKLDHGENLLGVLRALLTEASTHRMELIIIYLIAFEVMIALYSHGYFALPAKIWNMILGEEVKVEEVTEEINNTNEEMILSSLRHLLQIQPPPPTPLPIVDTNARLV